MYGQTKDLNSYLATRPTAPVHTLRDIIAFNNTHAAVALKYGQAIFLAADQLDVSPGSADTARYLTDRAQDLALTRTGLDAVYNGPDGIQGTEDDFDAILFRRTAARPHLPRRATRASSCQADSRPLWRRLSSRVPSA
jgi:amidase